MKNRQTIRKVVPWVLIGVITLGLAVLPALARSNAEEALQYRVISAQAQQGGLDVTLAGGGTLKAQNAEKLELYDGVKVTELPVKNGDYVHRGDVIARVDKGSAMTAILNVREALEEIEKQIHDIEQESRYGLVRAGAPGRVKAVYARYGDSVRDVMLEYGALAVLSLDGKMALEFTAARPVSAGEAVTVTLANGERYPGHVERALDGKAEVSLTDDGPGLYDMAIVTASDGTVLGEGELYVHSAWNAVASSGTISYSGLEEGEKVGTGTVIVRLENLEPPSEYAALLSRHEEYSERLAELFPQWMDGEICAPCDGYVSGLDKGIVKTAATGERKIRLLSNVKSDPKNVLFYVFFKFDHVNEDGTWSGVTAVSQGYDTLLDMNRLREESAAALMTSGVEVDDEQPFGNVPQKGAVFYQLMVNGVPVGSYLPLDSNSIPPIDISGMIGGFGGFNVGGFSNGSSSGEEDKLYSLESEPLCLVTPDEIMTVRITTDELDVLQYRIGMEAEILVDALPGQRFTGEVTWIGGVGENAGGNSKYPVELTLKRSRDMLDGMNASAIVYQEHAEGLLIPVAAVYDSGSRTFVYTGYDEKNNRPSRPVEVETGASDGIHVVIPAGLAEGQTVWYGWYGQ